jgi:Uma2 family endonuclease
MGKTLVVVGPKDHGRSMRLEEFDRAETETGHRYELSRGIITVSDVPNFKHLAQLQELRRMLAAYEVAHPRLIHTIAGGGECKLLLWDLQSERHPDLALYKAPPPRGDESELWSTWIPELVVEIVSPSSEQRDYHEKPAEYLAFGVHEYWVIDAAKEEILVLRRRGGRWAERIVKGTDKYATQLLPGFELDVAAVFEAARGA